MAPLAPRCIRPCVHSWSFPTCLMTLIFQEMTLQLQQSPWVNTFHVIDRHKQTDHKWVIQYSKLHFCHGWMVKFCRRKTLLKTTQWYCKPQVGGANKHTQTLRPLRKYRHHTIYNTLNFGYCQLPIHKRIFILFHVEIFKKFFFIMTGTTLYDGKERKIYRILSWSGRGDLTHCSI